MKLSTLFSFLCPLAIISLILGLVYTTVQQSYRMGANDPQIQLAADIRDRLSLGRASDSFFTGDSVDISRSLGLFVSLYNAAGQPIKATGFLDGKIPQFPSGVFDFANRFGENRVSWQPRAGVRIALVLVKIPSPGNGFVAAGRSLKEVEIREANLGLMVGSIWLICVGIGIFYAFLHYKKTLR
jgi:hypothetical protein